MANETESAGVEVLNEDECPYCGGMEEVEARVADGTNDYIPCPHPCHRTTAEAGKRELVEALRPFAEEAQRWEPRGGAHWPDAVPFPANSFSTIRIGDLRQARATLAKHGGPA